MFKLNFSTIALSKAHQAAVEFLTHFTGQKGTVNIVNKLSLANSSFTAKNLRKNLKVFPRAVSRGMNLLTFFPTNVRLETSLCRILDARGGFFPPFVFLCRIVKLTPVRYNGGQVYIFGQYYQQTPVIL